jgi:hypothetical protein
MATAKDRARWYVPVAEYWKQNPITWCEINLPVCSNLFITPAHSRKRELIQTPEQMAELAWACDPCHKFLDQKMSHAEMEQTVKEAIARRESGFGVYAGC